MANARFLRRAWITEVSISIPVIIFYKVFQLDLTELMDFQRLMRKFLTIAGVALGTKAPIGPFTEIPSEDIFDEGWIRNNIHCSPAKLHTIGLKQEAAGFKQGGLLREDVLDSRIFNQTRGYSSCQLAIDQSKEFGKCTDDFPFSIDGVIFARQK